MIEHRRADEEAVLVTRHHQAAAVDGARRALPLADADVAGDPVARGGGAARRYQYEVDCGMVGVNVPIPVPVAYYSFGGWKASLFGQSHVHGPEGIAFYTRAKVVTSRWPRVDHPIAASYHFPTT